MQVATLFRESATLLGATMEAGEIHTLKMPVFVDNTLKPEQHDEGYETSVDQLELRGGTVNNDHGKMNHSLMDQHAHISRPQLLPMQHLLHANQIDHSMNHRLHMAQQLHHQQQQQQLQQHDSHLVLHDNRLSIDTRPQHNVEQQQQQQTTQQQQHIDNRLNQNNVQESIDSSRSNGKTIINTDNSTMDNRSNDNLDTTSQVSLEIHVDNRRISVDSRSSVSNDDVNKHDLVENRMQNENKTHNLLNTLDDRILNHDSDGRMVNIDSGQQQAQQQQQQQQQRDHENQLQMSDKTLDNRDNQVDNNDHMLPVENRVPSRESQMMGIENRVPSRENHMMGMENRVPSRENHLMAMENRVPSRENHMMAMENRVPSRENHMIGMENRVPSRDSHMMGMENRVPSRENLMMGIESRVSSRENHRLGIENRVPSRDASHMMGLENCVPNRENHMLGMENRVPSRDSHMMGLENRGASRESHMLGLENRVPSRESHILGMDNRIPNRENHNIGNLDNRNANRDSSHVGGHDERRDNHLTNIDTRIPSRDNHLVGLDNRIPDRQMVGLSSTRENHMVNMTNNHSTGHDPHLVAHENRMNMDNCEPHMNNIDNRLLRDNHIGNIVNHDSHMGSIDSRLGRHEGRLSNHDNMGNMDNRTHDGRLVNHDNHMSAMERLSNHDARMGNLDTRLLNHHDNRMSIENRMTNHLNSIESRMAAVHHDNYLNSERMSGLGHDPRHHLHDMMDGHEMNPHLNHMNQHPHQHLQTLHHPHAHHPHPLHLHHPHHPHHGHPHMKCDSMEDPYSFVDEESSPMAAAQLQTAQSRPSPLILQPVPKKRGRKKKIKSDDGLIDPTELLKKETSILKPIKERKKHDRFNGMPEEEVVKRTLPDHLTTNLDIVIIGINPGLFAAYKGHHYAGPGNHFWKCLYLSGLTPEPMTADDDYKLLQVGIGFTNMVARATKGSADLTRKEIKEGSQILLEKLQKYKPKIAVFNGKLIYEVFSGNKDFNFGRQPDFVDGTNTYMWVMPSSSARCAQLPRAADKVPFYAALKKFRDYLNGIISDLDETEVVFNDQKLKTFYEPDIKGEQKGEHGNFYPYGRLPANELTDLSNAIIKKEPYDPSRPEKKKRGRPKKIRIEGEEPPPPKERIKKEKPPLDLDAPKKKRGRPKKIKTDDDSTITSHSLSTQANGGLNVSEHTSSSTPASTCFSPPIQSPTGFCQGFSPAYAQTQGPPPPQYNTRVPSPTYHTSPHHPSPIPAQYSQSPPPASQSQSQSQPFTHSDLSSEISAAISSEHLGSPPPTSPSLGPPDFEPPTSMPDDAAGPVASKEEPEPECRFPSPAPSESTYQQYRGFTETELETKTNNTNYQPRQATPPEFTPKRASSQDVASKSLSGLESLVDQIPSIAEGGAAAAPSGTNGETFGENQPAGQYDDYLAYPGYSTTSSSPAAAQPAYPHYTTSTNYSTAGYLPPTQSSFSVSSLANSSAHGHDTSPVASSFSVSSLASNYTPGAYPNLMGAPHLVVPQPGLFPTGMNMTPNYQYPGQYPGGPTSFSYSSHTLHVPSPNYPPYAPYTNTSYPQPYLANHVLDRIKQERMDIGFGSF